MKAYELYRNLIQSRSHTLIAGATGSGKSVLINALMYHAMEHGNTQFILIDPKRVELVAYKNLPQTICYADEKSKMISALQLAVNIIEKRYVEMQKRGQKLYPGGDVFVVIDELADLMTTRRREVEPLIQRIGQVGRASKVYLLMATQCPLACVIPTTIKCNCDIRIGLRTACAQDSRNIIGVKGCETLPDPRRCGKGYGIIRWNGDITETELPMISDADLEAAIKYYTGRKTGNGNQKTETVEKRGFLAWLLNNIA